MSEEQEREYYIAGGADLEKTRDFIKRRREKLDEAKTLSEHFGSKGTACNGHYIGGIIFDEEPLGPWRLKGYTSDNERFYFPSKATKAGKEMAKRIDAVRFPSIHQFHAMFDKTGGVLKGLHPSGRGQRILYISWEHVGDQILLSVPVGSEYQPDGSTKIKMSEYWAMKEALKEAA